MTIQKKSVFSCNDLGINKFLYFIVPIIFALFFCVQFVSAQDSPSTTNIKKEQLEQSNTASIEAVQDSRIDTDDLGVKKNNILPDNPLYGFKRFGRNLRETFTFNKVKKQKVRLENANKELAEAKILFDKKPKDAKVLNVVNKSFVIYKNKIAAVKNDSEKMKTPDNEDSNEINNLLNYTIDTQIKHQKVFSDIEDNLLKHNESNIAPKIIEIIQKTKDSTASYVGEILTTVEKDSKNLESRINKIMNDQKGSALKEIRNVEIINKIRVGAKGEMSDAFKRAEKKSMDRLSKSINKISKENRVDTINRYIKNVQGNELQHFKVFDKLKQRNDTPNDVIKNIEKTKDIIAKRFQERIKAEKEKYNEEFSKKMINNRFSNFRGEKHSFEKTRVIEDIGHRININNDDLQEEIKKERELSIEKFKEEFPDAHKDAEKFKELSIKMEESPDPTTFRLLQELESRVLSDPRKRDFIKRMEKTTKNKFVEKYEQDGDEFLENITTSNPEDIKTLEKLRKDFTDHPEEFTLRLKKGQHTKENRPYRIPQPNFEQIFNRAVEKQTEHFIRKIESIENKEDLVELEKRIGKESSVFNEIKLRQREFEKRTHNIDGKNCMEKCIFKDCKDGLASCMSKNKQKCEVRCNMFGINDPRNPSNTKPDKESQCIMDCVGEDVICMPSSLGEINPICEKCAKKCTVYYDGPCMTDDIRKIKEKKCKSTTSRLMKAVPIFGKSGQGHECEVDIKCVEVKNEFGDTPGTGPDNRKSGYAPDEYNIDTDVYIKRKNRASEPGPMIKKRQDQLMKVNNNIIKRSKTKEYQEYKEYGPPSVEEYKEYGPPSVEEYKEYGPPSVEEYKEYGPPSVEEYKEYGPPNNYDYNIPTPTTDENRY